MILAIDVYYQDTNAKAVAAWFDWQDDRARVIRSINVEDVGEYVPGNFYQRELPCILKVMELFDDITYDTIIIDGHVYTDNNGKHGLGGKLWEAVGDVYPIIGVAKSRFATNGETVTEVLRGESANPLYVSAIGMETNKAAELVKNMKGPYRIPAILKELDTETRNS